MENCLKLFVALIQLKLPNNYSQNEDLSVNPENLNC